MPVVHICTPDYSGGRDQEHHHSKPAQANRPRDPISKTTHHKKRAGGVAQDVGSEFKPQYCKKRKRKEHETLSDMQSRKRL
jgi:hypothetical protein